ncbi:MAG: c-type cytochrome biogenesis protein CcmI [Rhodospirillales bacterium]|nr:c-type cytochrome biogenesis protein CcmI [Rhodospirillales bacterium]
MSLFFALAAVLTLITLALLLVPLLRRQPPSVPTRAHFDLRVFRDQLAEVDRDQGRGLLGASEAEAARNEVKRRMLAAGDAIEHAPPPKTPGRGGGRLVAAALVVVLPTAAALIYAALGAPGNHDQPLAARQAELAGTPPSGEAPVSMEAAITQLAQRLEQQPDDAGGWYLLGRAYLSLDRYDEAITALSRAQALAADVPEVVAALAEAQIAAAGGRIGDAARAGLQHLLALDPSSPQARFMLALDRAQQGDLRAAAQGWTDLLAMAPPDAPWVAVVKAHLDQAAEKGGIDLSEVKPSPEALVLGKRIAEANALPSEPGSGSADSGPAGAGPETPGPSDSDVAAAAEMTPQARTQMIRGMVDRLAARLNDEPDDLDGWRRLARAYDVLGETDKAAQARARIAELEQR